MTIAAVSPLEVSHPQGWTWQPETRRYRDPSSGRFTSSATVKQWRDTFIDRRQQSVRDLASALSSGWITSASWREQMGEIQRETYGVMAALGRGGLDAMQLEDWNRVNAQLTHQQPYLEKFTNDIESGKLSEDQIGARSELYVGSAVQAFEAGRAAAWGDPELPELPGDGNTECGGNCRCHWDINPTEAAWECTWTGTNDERTCMGCANNQDTWNPLIVPYPEPALLGPPMPPGASVRSEILAPPPPVGTVVSGETLMWTQTKAGRTWVDASGRFTTSYEHGWQLIDSQSGTKEPFNTLRLAMKKAEALAKTSGVVVPPPVTPPSVVSPVKRPTTVEKPTLGREVEVYGPTAGIRAGWRGTIVEISGKWAVVQFPDKGQATYQFNQLKLLPATDTVPMQTVSQPIIWNTSNRNYYSSRNYLWQGSPRFEVQYQKGWTLTDNKTGKVERFKFQRDAAKRADEISSSDPSSAPLEITVGGEVTIVGGGYRIGWRGTVDSIQKLGADPRTWVVHVSFTSGGAINFTGADVAALQPPEPPPAEVKVTADQAIEKLYSLRKEHMQTISLASRAYSLAQQQEQSYLRAWQQGFDGVNNSKIQTLSEEWSKAVARTKLARVAYEKAQRGFVEQVRQDLLYHDEPAQINVHFRSPWEPEVRAEIERDIEGFRRMVGRGRLDGLDIDFLKTRDQRSFYQLNTVNLGQSLRTGATVVHELGHWLEDRNSVAADLIQSDYDTRTNGETAKSLRKLLPAYNYDPGEFSKPDKFRDPYMGKVYSGRRVHELLSMGMEQMYIDPLELLIADEATFRVVWEVLHSGSHVVPSSGQAIEKKHT